MFQRNDNLLKRVVFYIIFVVLLAANTTLVIASSGNNAVFEKPKKDEVVMKDTEIQIKGYILADKNIIKAVKISLDSYLWRDAIIIPSNDNYTHFTYDWMAGGKGKTVLYVKAIQSDNKELEDRVLFEVKSTDEKDGNDLKTMLHNYQKEQEEKERKKQEALNKKDDTNIFLSAEMILEKSLGAYLLSNWKVLIPSQYQQQFLIGSAVGLYNFIKQYPIGRDIMNVVTIGYMAFSALLILFFVIIKSLAKEWEYLRYTANPLNWKRYHKWQVEGYLFDIYTLAPVRLAKISFIPKGNENPIGEAFTDQTGYFRVGRLPEGEYKYVISKNGYKDYVIEEVKNKKYRDYKVVSDTIEIKNGECPIISLPAQCQTSKDRIVMIKKTSLLYPVEKFVITNTTAMTGYSMMFLALLLLFDKNMIYISLGAVVLIGYLIYRQVFRFKGAWGIVVDRYESRLDWMKLVLKKGNQIYSTAWTDYEGRYNFGKLKDGVYKIEPGNEHLEIVSGVGKYHDGTNIVIKDGKLTVCPINMVLRRKTTK